MKSLEELLAQCKQDCKTETVEAFGETFTVREMSGAERDAYEQILFGQSGKKTLIRNMRATLVALTVIDSDGNLRFGEEMIDSVGKLPASGLNKIFQAAAKLNALGASDVEEAAKNSPPDPDGTSTSA